MDRYSNRRTAGHKLAARLKEFEGDSRVIVLALPRGGVPVAYEVAGDLRLPLDIFIVRKLGAPGQEELAMGAIASGGVRVLNEDVVRRLGVTQGQLQRVIAREEREVQRRENEYRDGAASHGVEGKTVILVDDGLATGATMSAAVMALRQARAGRILAAAPVGSSEACNRLAGKADGVICPVQPADFKAVGEWYDDFSQTPDEEVRELLAQRPGINEKGGKNAHENGAERRATG